MFLLISTAALAGIDFSSWSVGSASYPDDDYTPSEVEIWITDAPLPEDLVFGGWVASWGGDTLSFSGMEDGSVCFVEEGDYGYSERVSPIAEPDGQVVGWGYGSAYDGTATTLALHSVSVTGTVTGDASFSWSPSGWANGATGSAAEVPPVGAPWSIAATDENGAGVTLSTDRLAWTIGPEGLDFLSLDADGFFPLGSTVTVTVSWLSE
jgi:hypothetical protein